MEIKVGEYVRTRNQGIKKVKKIEYDIDAKENYYYLDSYFGEWEHQVVKHSKNIIDLIEVGDYVNGKCIEQIQELQGEKCLFYDLEMPIEIDLHFLKERDIKTIVTKEQFEFVEFRV